MRVISVFGPFQSQVLVEMSVDQAAKLVPKGALDAAGPSRVIDAAEREVESFRARDRALSDSALAASLIALAYEIDDPFNSATSKSMCARGLREGFAELRALAPPEERKGQLHALKSGRADRLGSGKPAA